MDFRKYFIAYFIGSFGVFVSLVYFGYEYIGYGDGFYEHLVGLSQEHIYLHLLVLFAIPWGMFVGHLYKEQMKAREDAKRSGELKNLLVDILGHDLLNSIGVIKGVSEILGEDSDLSGKKKEIGIIRRNAEKLEDIVKTATKYGEVESIEEIDFEQLDITSIIEKGVNDLKPEADKKNITIENEIKGKLVIKAAPLIEEVFHNIISNAIKYSPANSKVSISGRQLGDTLSIRVTDQGSGVEDKYKERIFQRFERGGKKGIHGLGLGLAIVKRIVDLHNGNVWVEDNPEGGSVFVTEIPRG